MSPETPSLENTQSSSVNVEKFLDKEPHIAEAQKKALEAFGALQAAHNENFKLMAELIIDWDKRESYGYGLMQEAAKKKIVDAQAVFDTASVALDAAIKLK